ncbi:hypothetical protein BurMR1_1865 [Burkholderia sp. MR1]|nr:hypothetical protein BurMR1_1865 [Burkholderia sp. MR1]
MSSAAWVLIALAHTNGGSQVSFQDFDNRQACIQAADTLIKMAQAGGEAVRVNCVAKNGSAY